MTFRTLLVWLKRATGIGYKHYPVLPDGVVDQKRAKEFNARADKLAHDIEELDKELRRNGFRIRPFSRD